MGPVVIILMCGLVLYVIAKWAGKIQDITVQSKVYGWIGVAYFILYFAVLIFF